MVKTQLRRRNIQSGRVLEALAKIPRHLFVDEAFGPHAYEDGPLAIACGQTISQPYIVAFMTEALQIAPDDKVLEIGTGSGYQTAVLAELAAYVYTVEICKALQDSAHHLLDHLGYTNVYYRHGDGYDGWPEAGPFNKVIVTAAPDVIPEALIEQLAEGGRMVVPVGRERQELILGVKKDGDFQESKTISVRFVPLICKTDEKEKGNAR